jgi:hypothetical protein
MGSDPPLPKGLLQRVIDLRAFERPPTAAITLDEMYTHTMVHSATTKVLDINLYRQSRSLPPELRLLQRNRRPPACSRTRQTTMSPESWLTSSLANHPIFTLPEPSSDDDKHGRRRELKETTMVVRGGDLLVAVGSRIRMCSLSEAKSGAGKGGTSGHYKVRSPHVASRGLWAGQRTGDAFEMMPVLYRAPCLSERSN